MSVVSVDVIGTQAATVEIAGGGRSYTVKYRVLTDDINDQSLTAMQAVGIPSIGDFYAVGNDSDAGAYPRSYSATLQSADADRKHWIVVVQFAGEGGGAAGGMNAKPGDTQSNPTLIDFTGEKPWDKPARLSGYGDARERVTVLPDHYTNPADSTTGSILDNSAGDSANPSVLPPIHWSYPSVIIEKDYQEFPQKIYEFANTCNKFEFFGESTGHWLMLFPRVTRLYTGQGVKYFNVQYEFTYSNEGAEGWNGLPVLDKGFIDADGDSKTATAGIPIQELQDLDGVDGDFSTDGPHLYPAGGWNPYLEKDFAELNIPLDWNDEVS